VKKLGENFDKIWFDIIKVDIGGESKLLKKLESLLENIGKITTSTGAGALSNLMGAFNKFTLITLNKYINIYPRILFSWNSLRGSGLGLKTAQIALEQWFRSKANTDTQEMSEMLREYEKTKEAFDKIKQGK